jgi:hypothetical protein
MANGQDNNEVGVDSTVEVKVIPSSDEQNENDTSNSLTNE